MRQLYAFRAHFNTKKDGEVYRSPKVNQDRDGWAMHLLIEILRPRFDVVIPGLNTEAPDLVETSVKSRLGSGDLVLTSTRFGMNDIDDQVKTPVFLGNNWLEGQILEGWRIYVRRCSRKQVELTEQGMRVLDDTCRQLGKLEFSDTDDASFGSRRAKERRTAGYIIYTKELWKGGPGCLSVFGMSGTVTLGFTSIVCERWSSDLLSMSNSEVVVAEIVCHGDLVPAAVQGFPDFWKRWTLKIHRGGVVTSLPPEVCPSRLP
jgi:hypothetical protein